MAIDPKPEAIFKFKKGMYNVLVFLVYVHVYNMHVYLNKNILQCAGMHICAVFLLTTRTTRPTR